MILCSHRYRWLVIYHLLPLSVISWYKCLFYTIVSPVSKQEHNIWYSHYWWPGNITKCGPPLLLERRWSTEDMKHPFELHLGLLEWKCMTFWTPGLSWEAQRSLRGMCVVPPYVRARWGPVCGLWWLGLFFCLVGLQYFVLETSFRWHCSNGFCRRSVAFWESDIRQWRIQDFLKIWWE